MDHKIVNHEQNSLNFTFRNIGGYNSRILGNKLSCPDFLTTIKDCDVIGLVETHVHTAVLNDLAIPGFNLIHYSNKERNSKSKTAPGGIALFCKENVSSDIIPIKRENKDVIWVKINKNLVGLTNDIYLGTVYHTPSGKKKEITEMYEALTGDVEFFHRKGHVLLQGDFNAHTNLIPDFIEHDQLIEDTLTEENLPFSRRNSEDTSKVNLRGKELLEFCKAQETCILNGRKTGDLFGKFTSFQWNGKGVVDYVIASHDLYSHLTYLNVGSYSPWLSDHCPLFFKLNVVSKKIMQIGENLHTPPDRFFFRKKDIENFSNTLKTQEIKENLNRLEQDRNMNAQTLATELTNTLLDVTKKANIKPSKAPNCHKNEPWFDKDCVKLKNSLKSKCKKLCKNQGNFALQCEVRQENKKLRKLIKMKKYNYKQTILDDLKLKRKDQRAFWKILDKLQSTHDENVSTANSISGKKNCHAL